MGDGVLEVAETLLFGELDVEPSSERRGLGLRDSVGDSGPFFDERKDMGVSKESRARLGRDGALRCFGARGGLEVAWKSMRGLMRWSILCCLANAIPFSRGIHVPLKIPLENKFGKVRQSLHLDTSHIHLGPFDVHPSEPPAPKRAFSGVYQTRQF